jgi:hypothetical protein
MEDVVIHYRTFDQNAECRRPDLYAHYYPYHTLGLISSHVQPHFVICNMGQKLNNLPSFGLGPTELEVPVASIDPPQNILQGLLSTHILYLKWINVKVPPRFTSLTQHFDRASEGNLRDNVLSDDAYHSANSTRSKNSRANTNTVQPRDLEQDQLTCSSPAHDEPVTGNDRIGTQMHGWNIKEWAAHVSTSCRHDQEHNICNGQYDHDVYALPSQILLTV